MNLADLTVDEAFEFGIRLKCAELGLPKESRDTAVQRIKLAMLAASDAPVLKEKVAFLNSVASILGSAGLGTLALGAGLAVGLPLAFGKATGNLASSIRERMAMNTTSLSAGALRSAEEMEALEAAIAEVKQRNKRREKSLENTPVRSRPMF